MGTLTRESAGPGRGRSVRFDAGESPARPAGVCDTVSLDPPIRRGVGRAGGNTDIGRGAAMEARRDITGTVVFAGGGTGGHLSPGLAVAEELASHSPGLRRVFACSTRPIDAFMLGPAGAGERFEPIDASVFSARPAALWRFLRGWSGAVRQSRALLEREKASVVVALGGFVAAPVVRAARSLGIPAVLLNLDVVPGKSNRLVARWCRQVISTCPTPTLPLFASRIIPMPLRRSTLASTFGGRAGCRARLGFDAEPHTPVLLITGASQGAASINDLMIMLAREQADVLRGWQIYHLTGHGREGDVSAAYEQAGIAARVQPFQSSMGLAWGAADLAISRAGANSVAEIAANAVPTLFLPYPHHRDQHQRFNAAELVEMGGALCVEDHIDAATNLRKHGDLIRSLLSNATRRESMRKVLEASRPENGAAIMARMVLGVVEPSAPAESI